MKEKNKEMCTQEVIESFSPVCVLLLRYYSTRTVCSTVYSLGYCH